MCSENYWTVIIRQYDQRVSSIKVRCGLLRCIFCNIFTVIFFLADPVYIRTSVYLRAVTNLNDANMVWMHCYYAICAHEQFVTVLLFQEFSLQFRFQQEWFDQRLKFDDVYFRTFDVIHLARDQKLWRPDTFFQNEKRGWYHYLDQPNAFMMIRSDGTVVYNCR